MDWEPWLNERWVTPVDDGGRQPSLEMVRTAWDTVVAARAAYLQGDWDETDRLLRASFVAATYALLKREDLDHVREFDFETAQRLTREMLGEQVVDRIYEKARILRNMMPLGEHIGERDARLVRRSLAASSEYVAMIESYCFM